MIKETDKEFIANTYARFDVCIARGSGAQCADENGKQYIDFTSGIGVNSLGFCDKGWADAVSAQANLLNHTSNLYYTQPGAQLAEALCTKTGFKKVFFANSGAEANEGAIKAARKYSFDKYGEGRADIITLVNSFHGRTITTLAATGQDSFHTFFQPFTGGFSYAAANDAAALESAVTSATCAVMIELVQGEGGVIALNKEYVKAVAELCAQKDILLIVDEVQTGIGRTGTLFSYQQFNIMPDIITSAKGLGGGLPIGAVLLGEKLQNTLSAGTHGSTFGANPICCAGANYVIQQLTQDFLNEVSAKGEYIKKALSPLGEVSGMGLMIGLAVAPKSARETAVKCLENGLMILTAKEKIRLLPPLNITYEQIDNGIEILKNVLGA